VGVGGFDRFLTGSGWGKKQRRNLFDSCLYFQVDSFLVQVLKKKQKNNKRNNKGLLLHLTLNFFTLVIYVITRKGNSI